MSKIYSLEDYRLFGYFFKFLASSLSFIDRAVVAYETYHSVDPECRLALVMYLLQRGRDQVITEWPTEKRKMWSHEDYLLWVSQNNEHILYFLQDLRERRLSLEEAAIEFWRMIESFSQDQECYFALGFCLLQSDFMPYEKQRPDNRFAPGKRSFARICLGSTNGYITPDDQVEVIRSLVFLTSGFQRVAESADEILEIPASFAISNEDNRFLIAREQHGERFFSCHPQAAYALNLFIQLIQGADASKSKAIMVSLDLPGELIDALLPDSIEVFARNLRGDIDICLTAHIILKRELKWGICDALGRQFVDSVLNSRELESIIAES